MNIKEKNIFQLRKMARRDKRSFFQFGLIEIRAELKRRRVGMKELRNTVTPAVAAKRAFVNGLKQRLAVATA